MIGQMAMFVPNTTLPLRQRVTVELITLAQARYTLEKLHYLHRTRTGRQLNYAVLIDGMVDGVITYAYPPGANHLEGCAPGEYIEFARLFLAANIPHTASCAVGKSLKRIRQDWAREFPESKPVRLVVSWSDTVLHRGTIYKAANFVWVKLSAGALAGGLSARKQSWGSARKRYADLGHPKDCWIYRWKD